MARPQRRTPKQDDQRARYRDAAEMAIEQLDWCINYLRQIKKPNIARALEHNRNAIVSRARHGQATR